MKTGKKFAAAKKQVPDRAHSLEDAIPLVQKVKFAKFDETVEMALRLGVDPKHADQMVRGTVVLPHGLGKTKRVLAIAGGEKQKEAQDAGADFVGGEEMVEKIQGGWMDFDAVVATPDMMRAVGRLGKVLGPRGLMPNPKTGTVTFDIAQGGARDQGGQGRVPRRQDRHRPRADRQDSFPPQNLVANAQALVDSVVKAKPPAAKGKYLRSVTISSTMGPGMRSIRPHRGGASLETRLNLEARRPVPDAPTTDVGLRETPHGSHRAEKEAELEQLEKAFRGTDSAMLVDFAA